MSIRDHINLIESFGDGEHDDSEVRYDRERKVVELLRQALHKVGLLDNLMEDQNALFYMEDDREAWIRLYEDATVDQLHALKVFGDVSVRADPSHRDVLLITIRVQDGFDADAKIV